MKFFPRLIPLLISILLFGCSPKGAGTEIVILSPTLVSTPRFIDTATPSFDNTRVVVQENFNKITPTTTPTKISYPTQTNIPTINPTEYLSWDIFQNDEIGISFEYPLYFALEPYSKYGCAPDVSTNGDGFSIDVGERIWVTGKPFDQSKVNLSDYLEQIKYEFQQDSETNITGITWGYVGNVRAVMVEYRFGALNRYGVDTYFVRNNILYAATFSAGGTCDVIATHDRQNNIPEFNAYWQMLQTWRFLK